MANVMLRNSFMGEALKTGTAVRQPVKAQAAQALFGNVKKEAQKLERKAKRAVPSPSRLGPGTQARRLASQAKKAIPKPVQKRVSSGRSNRGWLSGPQETLDLSKYYGPTRDLYLPAGLLDPNDVREYLDGTLPGDYGYDPLGFGADGRVNKLIYNEVFHGRWAMLAAAGGFIPEFWQANGADIRGGVWFETTKEMLDGNSLNYFAVPWAVFENPLPLGLVAAINIVLIGTAEAYRAAGRGPPGYAPSVGDFDSSIYDNIDQLYPGGPFDPLGLADDPEVLRKLKVNEVKNGRLAMIGVLGFWVQSAVTGEGPYANYAAHLSDPFGNNLLTILGNEDRLPSL